MDIQRAMLNPAAEFTNPTDVFQQQSLTREQKIKILRQWEYDARELAVADDENMPGGPPNQLDEIVQILCRLNADRVSEPKQRESS
ncbi:hypothetical protein SAMN05660420_01683 [Desulfuromusa kysingii]|uniref:Uncharacterized protein n=1 Tax=Desulfuromusa kysingii TaxID=37625 RepID=A0A1H3ZUM9_9BACT|nr:hypothetical protein [Desulfuromusa kysingii]SEA27408.1 hypothetical protein SAMN05660420_01683 [Desulfuromusa kysingii]